MGLYAMWVPGSAAIGYSGTLGYGYAGGGSFSTEYARNPGGIAVNIPTPVIVDGRRSRLAKVIFLYDSRKSALKNVAVLDGKRLLKEKQGFPVGDYSHGLTPENTIDFEDKPEVQFGIQIFLSFEIDAPIEGRHGPFGASMSFAGFGADFLI